MQRHAASVTKPLSGSVISPTLVTGKCLAKRHVGEKSAGSCSHFSQIKVSDERSPQQLTAVAAQGWHSAGADEILSCSAGDWWGRDPLLPTAAGRYFWLC